MQYEETPIKNTVSKEAVKKLKYANLDKLNTWSIIWHIVKRHKYGLVLTYAIIITVTEYLPFVPDLIIASFER